MIYEMYITGMRDERMNQWYNEHYKEKNGVIDDWKALGEVLKNTSHTFILMPGPSQHDTITRNVKKHHLEEYVLFQIPYKLTNPVHPGERRIGMTILKGKGNEV